MAVLALALTSTASVIFEAPVATEVVVPWPWLIRVAKNDGFCMSAARPSLSWGLEKRGGIMEQLGVRDIW